MLQFPLNMPEKYAELKLYFGFVVEAGRGEGRFEREPSSDGSRRAIAGAREIIVRYLQPGGQWGLHIGYCKDGVASSEREALLLIVHAEANFQNASGIVAPYDMQHGSTRFYRVIRFAGAIRTQTNEIINMMKQSGHIPCKIDTFGGLLRPDEEEFMRNNDKQWRSALRFYP